MSPTKKFNRPMPVCNIGVISSIPGQANAMLAYAIVERCLKSQPPYVQNVMFDAMLRAWSSAPKQDRNSPK